MRLHMMLAAVANALSTDADRCVGVCACDAALCSVALVNAYARDIAWRNVALAVISARCVAPRCPMPLLATLHHAGQCTLSAVGLRRKAKLVRIKIRFRFYAVCGAVASMPCGAGCSDARKVCEIFLFLLTLLLFDMRFKY